MSGSALFEPLQRKEALIIPFSPRFEGFADGQAKIGAKLDLPLNNTRRIVYRARIRRKSGRSGRLQTDTARRSRRGASTCERGSNRADHFVDPDQSANKVAAARTQRLRGHNIFF